MKLSFKKIDITVYLFVGVFLVNLIGVFTLNTLVLSDEIGTVANAAYLAGMDWSDAFAINGINYYKYGQALLYTLLFQWFNNYTLIYKVALTINSFFISIIPCIIYTISKNYLDFTKNESISAACLIGLLPSSLLWSKLLWAETLLQFIPWLTLWLLLSLQKHEEFSRTRRITIEAALGFFAVSAYMVHVRGLVLLITIVLIIIYSKISKKLSGNLIFFILGAFGGLLLDKCISNYLFKNMWLSRLTNNSIESTIMYIKKYDLLSWTGLRTLCNTILGWLYNVIGSSYGLVVIGAIVALISIFFAFQKDSNISTAETILHLFSILLFLGSFIVGIIFFIAAPYEILNLNTRERFDKLIYGRYLASSFGPLILVVFNDAYKKGTRIISKYIQTISVSIVAVLVIFFAYYSEYAKNTTIAVIQVCTLPMFLGTSSAVIDSFTYLERHMMLCTGIVLIGFVFVIICIQKRKLYLMTKTICFMFFITYLWSIFTCYKPINDFYQNQITKTKKTIDCLEDINKSYPYMAVYVERGIYSYQFAFPDYKVLGQSPGLSDEYNNLLIIDDDWEISTYLLSGDYYMFNSDTNVLIKGDKLNTMINRLGVETERITKLNIFRTLAMYDSNGYPAALSETLPSKGRYISMESIPVVSGEYRLVINSSDTNLNINVTGEPGDIEVSAPITSGNITIVNFFVKHNTDSLSFEVSNLSDSNIKMIELSIERCSEE